MENKGTSGTGLSPNLAAGISYLAGFVSGVIFFLIEKDDKFVRFHAIQSIFLSAVWIVLIFAVSILGTILSVALGEVAVVGVLIGVVMFLASLVVWIGGFVLWLLCVIKAFQGGVYRVPYLANMADKYV